MDAELANYVERKLAMDGNFLDFLDKPVLRFLLLKGDGSGPIYPPLYVPRLKMLDLARAALESGCCRDEIEMDFGDRDEEDLQSPWLSLMGQAFSAQRTFILKSGVISLFLKHGANPNATCRGGRGLGKVSPPRSRHKHLSGYPSRISSGAGRLHCDRKASTSQGAKIARQKLLRRARGL